MPKGDIKHRERFCVLYLSVVQSSRDALPIHISTGNTRRIHNTTTFCRIVRDLHFVTIIADSSLYELASNTVAFSLLNVRFFKAANRRVFDIYVDGSLFLNDYDIFQQAGSHNKANIVHRIINVTHNNGLNVELVAVKENPSINGIEIIPNNGNFTTGIATMAPSIAPTLAPIAATDPVQGVVRINAGGDDYIDSFGNTWAADKYVVNFHGQEYTDCHQPISSTVDDTLYCCHRWFAPWTGSPYVYSIPVITAGVYEVRLHFAEIVRS